MKLKTVFCLTALVLCMGAFSIPAFATDAPDTTPPSISASIQGDALQIAVNDDSGVEAVFVNGSRVNYRIDSALELPASDYAGEGEYITVYAIDFAGNKSKEVRVKNPSFTPPAAPVTPKEEKPFTPSGTGTVQDNATDEDGKEFFTIITPDDNEFFLVIDRQRESDSVYLLNAVTEKDLYALAQKDADPAPEPTPTPAPTPEPEPEPEAPPAKGVSGGTIFFILLAVAAAGGAGYYFKIYKPKQQTGLPDEFDEDEDEDEGDYEEDSPAEQDDPEPDDPSEETDTEKEE